MSCLGVRSGLFYPAGEKGEVEVGSAATYHDDGATHAAPLSWADSRW